MMNGTSTDELGVVTAVGLRALPDRTKVTVAGVVTHRQRPATAGGTTFVNLEDETGLVNVTVRPDLFDQRNAVLVGTNVLEVEGILQSFEGLSVRAVDVRPLGPAAGASPGSARSYRIPVESRDFR